MATMKPKILFFTANRAEFGYLLPFLIGLDNEFDVELMVTGAHLLEPWHSIDEIQNACRQYKLNVTLHPFTIEPTGNTSIDSHHYIQEKAAQLIQKNHYDYAFVLGDRPESLAFATASFLHQTPLIHYAGGDVTNNYYLDSTIRHAITKLSHLHLTLTQDAAKVVEQLGEESWRIHNVGISTFDFDRMGLLPSKEEISAFLPKLSLEKELIIFTYHAAHYKSAEENLEDYRQLLQLLEKLGIETIVTYPNNDTGSQKVIEYLENSHFPSHIQLVKNMGTLRLLTLYKNYRTLIIGNSSGGLLESALYRVPTLNIGDRQGDRKRVDNVMDAALEMREIEKKINFMIKNYDAIQQQSEARSRYFGSGESVLVLKNILSDKTLTRDKLLYKQFILRLSC